MINIRIKTRFWSIVLFLPIFFIALNCSNYTNRITNFDLRKDQIRKKHINDGSLSVFSADIDKINDRWVIKGETTDSSAYESILRLKDSLFKDILPVTRSTCTCVLGGSVFKEIGVFYTV